MFRLCCSSLCSQRRRDREAARHIDAVQTLVLEHEVVLRPQLAILAARQADVAHGGQALGERALEGRERARRPSAVRNSCSGSKAERRSMPGWPLETHDLVALLNHTWDNQSDLS